MIKVTIFCNFFFRGGGGGGINTFDNCTLNIYSLQRGSHLKNSLRWLNVALCKAILHNKNRHDSFQGHSYFNIILHDSFPYRVVLTSLWW